FLFIEDFAVWRDHQGEWRSQVPPGTPGRLQSGGISGSELLVGTRCVLLSEEVRDRRRVAWRIRRDRHEIKTAQAVHPIGRLEIKELAEARAAAGRPEAHQQHLARAVRAQVPQIVCANHVNLYRFSLN